MSLIATTPRSRDVVAPHERYRDDSAESRRPMSAIATTPRSRDVAAPHERYRDDSAESRRP